MHRENRIMSLARNNGLEFWDMDIIPTAEDLTCVDIGKQLAESLKGFIYTYEDSYQKIFCFPEEQTTEHSEKLRKMLTEYRDISFAIEKLDNLRLDDLIEEPIHLIRIDVSSSLPALLEGCKEHICKEHPQLALCLDCDCNNLWQIPKLLRSWHPEYRFYLRYYGKEIIPDRIILFAI